MKKKKKETFFECNSISTSRVAKVTQKSSKKKLMIALIKLLSIFLI